MNPLNTNGTYFAYLRKSRADREAEAHGEGETLARHEKILLDLADRLHLCIAKFYREIVSAENLQDRPVVNELLQDINTGKCDGVLVVEIERLARGDTSDQGTIAKYFKFSDTVIITPAKIYDPNDEFDEEYFEFGLFMSRREYKTINRRIQRGRIASLEEGKWIASTAPFGYRRVKIPNGKGYTLEIEPEQAEIVKLIYSLYLYGEQQTDGSLRRLGQYRICKKLDMLGIPTANGGPWSPSTIKDILTNYAYIGKVCWGKETERKILCDGNVKKIRQHNPDFLLCHGIHKPILSDELFYQAQELRALRPVSPVVSNKNLKNPLSGIVKCGLCGSVMTRTASNTKDHYFNLSCPNRQCKNVSAPLSLVENQILLALRDWLAGYSLKYEAEKPRQIADEGKIKESNLKYYKAELELLHTQENNAYDLLEQNIYTPDIFKQRLSAITDKIKDTENTLSLLKLSLDQDAKTEQGIIVMVPNVYRLLEAYYETDIIPVQNEILKQIICHVDYIKSIPNKKYQRDHANFILHIYPRLPQKKLT